MRGRPRPAHRKRAPGLGVQPSSRSCIAECVRLAYLVDLVWPGRRHGFGSRWGRRRGLRMTSWASLFCLCGWREEEKERTALRDGPQDFNSPMASLSRAAKDYRSTSTTVRGQYHHIQQDNLGLAWEPTEESQRARLDAGSVRRGARAGRTAPRSFSYPCTTMHTAGQASC